MTAEEKLQLIKERYKTLGDPNFNMTQLDAFLVWLGALLKSGETKDVNSTV